MGELIECLKCGWVHFAVTREYAENEVNEFNEFFLSLPLQKRIDHYGNTQSNINQYVKCWCGGLKFKPTKKDVYGSTIGPMIYEGRT